MTVRTFDFLEWIWHVETTIANAITQILPRDWDENDITKSWMRAIRRNFPTVKIKDLGVPYALAWDTVKLKGKTETSLGDIGVFVRLHYPKNITVEGVGFIEAKRKYPSGRYEQVKFQQLKRMATATPFHQLGLYSQTPILEAALGIAGEGWWPCLPGKFNELRNPLAAVVPTRIALALKSKRARELHLSSLPLSYQLCARYLRGYDIDFTPALTEAVKDGGAGAPSYLVIADVSLGGENVPPSTNGIIGIRPNGPYTSLETPPLEETQRFTVEKNPAEIQRIELTN